MFFIIGLGVVIGSVLGGYMPHGDLAVLWQPLEVLIILGAATGGFIIGNPKTVLLGTVTQITRVLKSAPHDKKDYLELLTLLYSIFKLANSKGALALETHIDNPTESSLFQQYPKFLNNHHAVEFLCDALRLVTMGSETPHELEAMLDEDIEAMKHESESVAHAITNMADGLPAFGIVAAVLGVIVTMGSIRATGSARRTHRRRPCWNIPWRPDGLWRRRPDGPKPNQLCRGRDQILLLSKSRHHCPYPRPSAGGIDRIRPKEPVSPRTSEF